jgi:hypothetical protein
MVGSPLISTLLERSSATRCRLGPPPSPPWETSEDSTRTVSAAVALCSGITSMSVPPLWSMRATMRIMRFTFEARSEMISMLAPVTAESCAFCGINGRSTGTSCAALTFETAITCVTTSSEVALTFLGRSSPGIWRMLASGSTLMMLPAGTAMKPCTCSTDRNPW